MYLASITRCRRSISEFTDWPTALLTRLPITTIRNARWSTFGDRLNSSILALEEIEKAYDYIIIDCPPSLGHLIDNALLTSQNILIPALAESTSKRAVELLFDHVTSIEQNFDISIRERGVVVNRVEETNEATEILEWLARAFDDTPRFEVRKRVALQRAHSAGVSLFEYDPEVDMCDVFLEIAAALDEQFGFGQPDTEISPAQEVSPNE